MLKWLNKILKKQSGLGSDKIAMPETTTASLMSSGMRFTLYQAANGGYVLEYHNYDEKTDRRHNSIHIIREDEELGSGIAQAMTLELLRR
jgi:hypothetical protein